MPFEKDPKTGKMTFNFPNFLATLLILFAMSYFFIMSFVLSKKEVLENPSINQIIIFMVGIVTTICTFYFGSSIGQIRESQKNTQLQKDVTAIALTTATGVNPNVATEIKIDKAVKISELKTALAELEPESEEAKKILAELEELEKIS